MLLQSTNLFPAKAAALRYNGNVYEKNNGKVPYGRV